MKTKFYYLLIACTALLFSQQADAQSVCGQRYIDTIFHNVSVTTVTYSTVYSQQMDIYQPVGDTASRRPVIVLAHGGSFVSGTRSDDVTVTRLCRLFAQRGYVTASIDYRLATGFDSTTLITEVIKALSDGKAAIRYFSKDEATTNTYKIDSNIMFCGGNSAGAVLAMHYGYIDSVGEVPPYLQTIINNNGGFEGNSGNPGYSSKIQAVISLAGGLNHPEWASPGDIPSVNAQGDQDDVVPYYCADAEGGLVAVRLCGLGSVQPYYTSNNITTSSIVFPGDGHVPWDDDTAKFDRIDTLITGFLAPRFVTPYTYCVAATGINEIAENAAIHVYPNPATNVVNVQSAQPVNNVTVFDATGRQVSFTGNLNQLTYQINTTSYSKGVYFVRFETIGNTAPVIKKIVIE